MAKVLSSGTESLGALRKKLQHEATDESEDLLGRIHALEFVGSIVGESTDLPEVLGDYEIRGLLGRGGMGTVYAAYQQSLEREVALKVLSPVYSSDPTMRTRFRKEARATASLHHQHIVPIYDYGERGGNLFFAMEKVDGLSLDKHISAARRRNEPALEWRDAAKRFAGVADALGLAHRRRLLHRDVKPGNILMQPDGTLSLADFGLSKVLGDQSVQLSAHGQGFLGTLHYAAPEQALGKEVGPASDLYALGVTFFEVVSGELPVDGKTTEALLQSVLYGTRKRLRTVLPKCPKDLDAVVQKLLCREPEDRYQDGAELGRDLQRVADGDPVKVRKQSPFVLLWRMMKKNPALAFAVATVCALTLATLALTLGLLDQKREAAQSKHQNLIVEAMQQFGESPGALVGPTNLFSTLAGVPAPGGSTVENVGDMRDLLAEAEATLPVEEAPMPQRIRQKLDSKINATVSELLVSGTGYVAEELLTSSLEARNRQRFSADYPAQIGLYREHLARAVARLTGACAHPEAARMDLVLATFLRPGAWYPRVLVTLLDAVTTTDPGQVVAALAKLKELADAHGEPGRRVVAGLLRSAASVSKIGASNMMMFDIPYAQRAKLDKLSRELVKRGPDVVQPFHGFEARFYVLAQFAKNTMDKSVVQTYCALVQPMLVDAVRPGSAISAWWFVFQLLRNPESLETATNASGSPLEPALQLKGWRHFLRIAPPPAMLERVVPRLQEFCAANSGLAGASSLLALVHTQLVAYGRDGLENSLGHADAWVRSEPDNPEAYISRFAVQLAEGRCADALTDATLALSMSAVPKVCQRELLELCRRIDGPLDSPMEETLDREVDYEDLVQALEEAF